MADRDTEDRAAMVLGAMKGLTSLVGAQTPGFGVGSEELVYLLQMITDQAAQVLPLEKSRGYGRPANGND